MNVRLYSTKFNIKLTNKYHVKHATYIIYNENNVTQFDM